MTPHLSVVAPLWQDRPREENLAVAATAARLGYGELWIGEMATYDAMALATAIGRSTDIDLTIGPLAVGVRSPMSMAMGVASVADLTGRQARLAIGASSPHVVTAWHGRSWRATSGRLRETARITRTLLDGGRTDHGGSLESSHDYRLRLDAPGAHITIAAFGPAAHGAGRTAPRVAVWLTAAVDPTPHDRRQVALARVTYLRAPGCAEMLEHAGFGSLVELARSGRASAGSPTPSHRSSKTPSGWPVTPTTCGRGSPPTAKPEWTRYASSRPRAATVPGPAPSRRSPLPEIRRSGTIPPIPSTEVPQLPDNPHRLPRTVAPHRYRLRLEPDLAESVFTGHETVDVTVETAVEEIVLNAAEIEIQSAHLTNGSATIGASPRYDEQAERVHLALEGEATPGEWELVIEFTGVLNDKLRGFYRSTFLDVEGEEQVIATTQFESTDARRAFPCWDEPDFKATFQTTLVVPAGQAAFTNTSETARQGLADGRVEISFAETMKMSTYLVAFVVGPFEATDPVDVDGVPTRVVAPRGKLHLADYALECAQFCFRYLRDYYGIDYPGDKLDHIAIPDFAFGAMENVGAITYRETALLIDPARASQAEKLRILDVIGHEIAHQWFGNLVTMGWWEGIWLNEAFASFMEMKATDSRRPEWKRWLAFCAVERPWAMEVDHLSTTRAVEFEVNSPEEADQMFDALTYGKGSSVLRMIEQFIGEDAFRDGVGTYLRRHSYGNTVTADLWAGLDAASEWPVGSIMDTWILQGGYPQIDVAAEGPRLHLSQRRFLAVPDETDQTTWKVPIRVRGVAGGAPFERALLLEDEDTVVDLDGPIEWVDANAGGDGFYRTRYSDVLFAALVERVHELTPEERYVLLYDTFAFGQTGEVGMTAVMELVDAFVDETEQAIWQLVFRVMGSVSHHLVPDQARAPFATWVRSVVTPLIDRLGRTATDDDSDLTRRLRGQTVATLGVLGEDRDTIEWARSTVDGLLGAGDTEPDPELATAALTILASAGDDEDHRRFFDRYESSDDPQEQLRYLRALTAFDDARLGMKTIDATLDGRIRSQDGSWVIASVLRNREAGPDLWTKVRRTWEDLMAAFPPMTVRRLVEGLPALSRPETAADVKAFFAETPVPPASKALAQNLELLDVMVMTREREAKAVGAWLRSRV